MCGFIGALKALSLNIQLVLNIRLEIRQIGIVIINLGVSVVCLGALQFRIITIII